MMQRFNLTTAAPAGFAALRAVEQYVDSSALEPRLNVLVKMRVSQMNGCAYCLHMHSEHARKIGESDVRLFLLDAWHESHLFSKRERAALAWAESLTEIATTRAPDDVYEEARTQFSERELADLSICVGMINAWNRLCIGAHAEHPSDVVKAAA